MNLGKLWNLEADGHPFINGWLSIGWWTKSFHGKCGCKSQNIHFQLVVWGSKEQHKQTTRPPTRKRPHWRLVNHWFQWKKHLVRVKKTYNPKWNLDFSGSAPQKRGEKKGNCKFWPRKTSYSWGEITTVTSISRVKFHQWHLFYFRPYSSIEKPIVGGPPCGRGWKTLKMGDLAAPPKFSRIDAWPQHFLHIWFWRILEIPLPRPVIFWYPPSKD